MAMAVSLLPHYIEYRVNETYTRFAHNHYLQLAAELGLPGIILFVDSL
jgi:O-antigen ligase